MNKRYLHHIWTRIRPVSYWYFLIGFILALLVSVWALRENNLQMIRLREAVITADERGEGVEEALNELRNHVYAHMNTDLSSGGNAIYPPIQLKHTYERLIKAEEDRVTAINKKVNQDAVTVCEQRFPTGRLVDGRVQCVQDYITKNTVTAEETVPKELYQFAFASPAWSPDLAGWSLVIAAVMLLLFLARFGLEKWLQHELDSHQ